MVADNKFFRYVNKRTGKVIRILSIFNDTYHIQYVYSGRKSFYNKEEFERIFVVLLE